MRAASQRLWTKTDLAQHRCGKLGVNRFAVVRAARECDFSIGEAKVLGGSGS